MGQVVVYRDGDCGLVTWCDADCKVGAVEKKKYEIDLPTSVPFQFPPFEKMEWGPSFPFIVSRDEAEKALRPILWLGT